MIVAGIVMNRLLTNSAAMLLWARTWAVVVQAELARREDRRPPARIQDGIRWPERVDEQPMVGISQITTQADDG